MIKILGHRGLPGRFHENELDGIREAARLANGAEVDVRRCGSGQLVLSHDPIVEGLVIADTSLERLQEAVPHLATCESLFAADVGGMLDLEVKNAPGEPGFEDDHMIAIQVAAEARRDDIVTSFNWLSMDAVRRAYVDVTTGLLFTPSIPFTAAVSHADQLGHRYIAPHHSIVTSSEEVQAAHELGVAVAVWTVNDRERFEELVEMKVDVIVSDVPVDAMAWLEEVGS